MNVSFSNYNETSLVVSWNSIDTNTSHISYTVELSDGQNNTVQNTSNTFDTFYELYNLASGALYTVSITELFNGTTCGTRHGLQSESTFNSTFTSKYQLNLVTRKPVFGVSDQVRHKLDRKAREDVRGLRFRSFSLKGFYQLRGDSTSSLRTRLCIMQIPGFLIARLN